MVAIFAGYRLFGILGLLGGPVLLNLLKVVLEADDIARGVKPEPIRQRAAVRGAGRRGSSDAEAPVVAKTAEQSAETTHAAQMSDAAPLPGTEADIPDGKGSDGQA
jgi:hypothetical protein